MHLPRVNAPRRPLTARQIADRALFSFALITLACALTAASL